MKGLEALHHPRIELAMIDISAEGKHGIGYMPFFETKQYTTVEKELKALEIIKEKVSVDLLEELNDDEPYWLDISCSTKLTKEEYDLLKEVLL